MSGSNTSAVLLSVSPSPTSGQQDDPRRSSSSSSSISSLSTRSTRSTETLLLRHPPSPPLLAHVLATWGIGVSLIAITLNVLLAPFAPLVANLAFVLRTYSREEELDRKRRVEILRRRRTSSDGEAANGNGTKAPLTTTKRPTTTTKRPFSLDAAILSTSGHSLALGTGEQATRAMVLSSSSSGRPTPVTSPSHHSFTPRPHHPRLSSISHLPTHVESAHSSEDEPPAAFEEEEDDEEDGSDAESDSDASEVHTLSEHGDHIQQQQQQQQIAAASSTPSKPSKTAKRNIMSSACSCPRKKRKARLQQELSVAGLSLDLPTPSTSTSTGASTMITRSAPVTSPSSMTSHRLSWPNSIASSPSASLGPPTPMEEMEEAEAEAVKRKKGSSFLRRLSGRGYDRIKRRSMNASTGTDEGDRDRDREGEEHEAGKEKAGRERRKSAKERRALSWHVS